MSSARKGLNCSATSRRRFTFMTPASPASCTQFNIGFPRDVRYSVALVHLRKALKPHICDLRIRKRSTGVTVSGPRAAVTLALLLVPEGFAILEVKLRAVTGAAGD